MTVDAALVARLAGLLADQTRMTLLLALLDGRAWTMGELARHAGVGASTASEQLSRLVAAGLLVDERQGRHRYLRLADPQVARMIEDLAEHANGRAGEPAGGRADEPAHGGTAEPTGRSDPADGEPTEPTAHRTGDPAGRWAAAPTSLRTVRASAELARGRTCYDHLAGRLGVTITAALGHRSLIQLTDGVSLTSAGATWLSELQVDVDRLRAARRPLIRTCLDWTERRPHLAGGVGAAIRETFLARTWVEPGRTPRVMIVTELGRNELPPLLGLAPDSFD